MSRTRTTQCQHVCACSLTGLRAARYGWLLGKGVVVQSIMRRAFFIPELPLALTWLAVMLLCLLVLVVEKAAGQRVMHDKKVCCILLVMDL